MNTIKFKNVSTKIVAHRGLSGIETENTNAAFVAAGNRSYYGIETDIHRTADGRFAVCHDDDLKRIAGVDIHVESTSLSELQSIVLFDKDGTKNREDLRIPVLENYISMIAEIIEEQMFLSFSYSIIDGIVSVYNTFKR